jgi:hypothetical protein
MFFSSCFNKKLPSEEIAQLNIITSSIGGERLSIIVTEKAFINEIIGIMETSSREPAKFMAEYTIEIKYKSSVRYVLVNENYIKIDGVTYMAKENLGVKLATLFKGEKH